MHARTKHTTKLEISPFHYSTIAKHVMIFRSMTRILDTLSTWTVAFSLFGIVVKPAKLYCSISMAKLYQLADIGTKSGILSSEFEFKLQHLEGPHDKQTTKVLANLSRRGVIESSVQP
jgi:hypothetical protein